VGQTGPKWPVGVLLDLPLDLDDYRRPEHGIGIMDVGAWLRSLGLAQYEALFRQNDIDAEVLGDLLFGGFSLAREYGRIGQSGRLCLPPFPESETARQAFARVLRRKQRRGYVQSADRFAG
jgi:predicted DNA-binding WGR domain protein